MMSGVIVAGKDYVWIVASYWFVRIW
jgi:hypothetical protein